MSDIVSITSLTCKEMSSTPLPLVPDSCIISIVGKSYNAFQVMKGGKKQNRYETEDKSDTMKFSIRMNGPEQKEIGKNYRANKEKGMDFNFLAVSSDGTVFILKGMPKSNEFPLFAKQVDLDFDVEILSGV